MAAAAGGFKHSAEAIGAGAGLCLTSEGTLVAVVGARREVQRSRIRADATLIAVAAVGEGTAVLSAVGGGGGVGVATATAARASPVSVAAAQRRLILASPCGGRYYGSARQRSRCSGRRPRRSRCKCRDFFRWCTPVCRHRWQDAPRIRWCIHTDILSPPSWPSSVVSLGIRFLPTSSQLLFPCFLPIHMTFKELTK